MRPAIDQVHPDCTGDIVINLPTVTLYAKFVLAEQGRQIHTLIYRQHVAKPTLGCDIDGGCDTLILLRSDGSKLGKTPPKD